MTDTTISTDPATLRLYADEIDRANGCIASEWGGGDDEDLLAAAAYLRAIAAEKEAQVAPGDLRATVIEGIRGAVNLDQNARGAGSCFVKICTIPVPLCSCLHNLADAALSAITAAGYEIRPRGETAEPAAWSYERARMFFADGSPSEWGATMFSRSPPHDPPDTIRNLTPLYRWPRAYTAGASLGGGLVAVPAPERPVIQCARCAGKGEFLDTTYDRTGEMVWCRPCHGTGKMLDDRDVKAALAALTEKGERS
jgi:hypothetical protein